VRVAQENAARAEQIYHNAGGALKDLQQARSDLVNAQSALRIADSAVGAARDKLVVFGKRRKKSRGSKLRATLPGFTPKPICARRSAASSSPARSRVVSM
jgi:cobalt-zinc-cadmium efflux system membrane fusion protein